LTQEHHVCYLPPPFETFLFGIRQFTIELNVRNQHRVIALALVFALLGANAALAQRIRFPQDGSTAGQGAVINNPLTPVLQGAQSPTLGTPNFDPYSTAPNAAASAPSLLGAPTTTPSAPPTTPFWQTPPNAYPSAGVGPTAQTAPPNIQIPGTTSPQGVYPQGVYPQQPAVLFPNGLSSGQAGQYLRLFQDVRMTYTWLSGSAKPQQMKSNDVQVGTTMNIPNFFFSGQPIRISPEFIFHSWEGPLTSIGPPPPAPPPPFPAAGTPAAGPFPTELPSRVYSTYLDFAWDPVITPQLSGDVEFSFGVFSDFDHVTQDSVRFRGTGLLVLGLTPTVALKGGVTYLDRLDLKLLPAGGLLWRPNPQTYFDIYFPKPKLAQYLYTVGNTDVWWYLMGEIGGGSWTIRRSQAFNDGAGGFTSALVAGRVDINDYRAGLGLEWTCQSGLTGLFEVAYVFSREIVFETGGLGSRKLDDTIMLRAGFTY
jgi:hypothetical protein